MNRDDIIRMMKEAGITDVISLSETRISALKRFFQAAYAAGVAAEREECAKVCESLFDMDDASCDEAEQCAAAIRARGNK